jgi:acetolactate synthase-1/2/3 large subunit
VLRELRQALPRDAAVFVDNGTIRLWSAQHFPVYAESCFFVNMGMASMGYAVAGSIGGQLARPDRPVVALCGDAAFAMNGMEVHTAVEHDAPVLWVVVNNGGLGMIHHGARMQFGRDFDWTEFREPIDAAAVASAVGADAYRANRPGELEDAVREALSRRRPAVVDVAVEMAEAPPMGARVKALDRDLMAAGVRG